MSFADQMLAAAKEPIGVQPAYRVGQRARVYNSVFNDGQTSTSFRGVCALIVSRYAGGMFNKIWCYKLAFPSGDVCEFREDEIYVRQKSVSQKSEQRQ